MPDGWDARAGRGFTNTNNHASVAETHRLILRRFAETDAEDLFRIYSHPETRRFLGSGPTSVDEVRTGIATHIRTYYDRYGFGLWGVILKAEDRLIGRCGILYQEIGGRKEPELAYLIDPEFWRRGIATEASLKVVELATSVYRFAHMIAVIHPLNTASIRVAERCGFEFERSLESFKYFGKVDVYSRQLLTEG